MGNMISSLSSYTVFLLTGSSSRIGKASAFSLIERGHVAAHRILVNQLEDIADLTPPKPSHELSRNVAALTFS